MPSRFRLRRVFGPLVRIVARGFIRLGISPNVISVLAFLLGLCAAIVVLLFHWYVIYALLVFCAGLLDGVDGEVARQTNQMSVTGGFFDSMLDRLVDVIVLFPFLWLLNPLPQLGPTVWWVALAITGSLLVSYARSRAQAAGVTDTDVGLAARSERLFILVVTSLLVVVYPAFPYLGLLLVAFLSHLTVMYRVLYYRRQLQAMDTPKP
ncbi:MAG: CDP-alcohol phosphatidyltransferase family protein [Candidatus Hermodarchaeota archaeon]|nr:CDP-alcohol phosphatidyltransferase family protein [Candidatus Hermodarchaeota archaeon]